MALETRKAGTGSRMTMNGMTTGNVERNTQEKDAQGAPPVVPAQPRVPARLGQLLQPQPHRLELRRLQHGRDHRRQRLREEALRPLGIAGLAHGPEGRETPLLLGQAAHEIEDRVDEAPGQVAAQGAHEHGANVLAARPDDAQRAREGEDHDQPEQHLGQAVDRVERALHDTWGGST